MRLTYFTASISFLSLMYTITQIGSFFHYWNKRIRESKQALLYLESDVCIDTRKRANLGEFNLCSKSEDIIAHNPFFRAMYDIAEDNSLCGRGKCYMFYTDVTSNIHKIIITLGFLSILVCFLSTLKMKKHREDMVEKYYSLPYKVD